MAAPLSVGLGFKDSGMHRSALFSGFGLQSSGFRLQCSGFRECELLKPEARSLKPDA
jgi:hypothetical protein